MFYPVLASIHAEARYQDLLREAELERQIRKPRPIARRLRRIPGTGLIALVLGSR